MFEEVNMQAGIKLVRAEISDADIIAFVNALPYGQIKQIIGSLLRKAVDEITKGTLTRGALLDGNYRISSKAKTITNG